MKIQTIIAGMLENNIYVAFDETNECFIVDPGAGGNETINFIKQNNLTPKAVLLTHGHHDHIGCVNQIVTEFNIPVYVGKEDGELLMSPKSGTQPVEKFKTIDESFTLKVGNMVVKTIATPGHTKGGMCFLVKNSMFTGDSIFKGTIGRCDLYGGNYHTLLKSVEKVADIDCRIFPGHGDPSTMEQERNFNPYFPANR